VIKLGVTKSLASIAKILLHRFYMKRSVADFGNIRLIIRISWVINDSLYSVAASMLFLSCKLASGSSFQKLHNIILVCGQESKKSPIDEKTNEYNNWRRIVLETETEILIALCFDIHCEFPHQHLNILDELNGKFF
jgi:hypothetical protein